MDYDDDSRSLQAYKVPKRAARSRCSMDPLSLQSAEYKDSILSKIRSGLKNPNSLSSFKFTAAYSISNADAETAFSRRKQQLKKEVSSASIVDCFGFVYLKSLADVQEIVRNGRLKKGNVRESYIGQPEMGLSVCQFADIYNPGEGKSFPRSGFLLIVKFIKGRICYVVEDVNPMEPQPNFECHISKVATHETFLSMTRAFHSTQIYMYEYSEDLDLLDEPTHVIPYAAVEFIWSGPPLFKLISVPLQSHAMEPLGRKGASRTSATKKAKAASGTVGRITCTVPHRIRQTYSDSTPVFCTQLQLRLPKPVVTGSGNDSSPLPLDIPVTLISYQTNWIPYDALLSPTWCICELMEWSVFEQGFLNIIMKDASQSANVSNGPTATTNIDSNNDNNNSSITDDNYGLPDVFNKRITISRSIENKLMKTGTSSNQAVFVNYLRMVINDPSRDRAKMARLIEHFHETKTVGRIRLNDTSDTLLFVFPDGSLSQNFGVPSVKTLDVNYLHVFLVTRRSMEALIANRHIDDTIESEINSQINEICETQEGGPEDTIISLSVLLQVAQIQNNVQKLKLHQICGKVTNQSLKFDLIDFCTDKRPLTDITETPARLSNGNVIVSPSDIDRPYDPIENPLAVTSGYDSLKTSLKRPDPDLREPSPVRKVKREEEKTELSSKLFEALLKAEVAPKPEPSVMTSPTYKTSYSTYDGGDRGSFLTMTRGANNSFSQTLDKSKFQTQFRQGVSVYTPQGDGFFNSSNGSRDQDFRFPDLNRSLRS